MTKRTERIEIIFAVPDIYSTFAVVNSNNMGTATAYSNTTETTRIPRTRRVAKVISSNQIEVRKTPESELMSVEEYFEMVWNRLSREV